MLWMPTRDLTLVFLGREVRLLMARMLVVNLKKSATLMTSLSHQCWESVLIGFAKKADKTIYIQSAYLLAEPETIEREYAPLETIDDNYEKYVVTLDDLVMPSNKGIKHVLYSSIYQKLSIKFGMTD